jgi:hypothetical protein
MWTFNGSKTRFLLIFLVITLSTADGNLSRGCTPPSTPPSTLQMYVLINVVPYILVDIYEPGILKAMDIVLSRHIIMTRKEVPPVDTSCDGFVDSSGCGRSALHTALHQIIK